MVPVTIGALKASWDPTDPRNNVQDFCREECSPKNQRYCIEPSKALSLTFKNVTFTLPLMHITPKKCNIIFM